MTGRMKTPDTINVAIIGTVGVPASYGGFETLAENLVVHNRDDRVRYTVYCSRRAYSERPGEFCGARLRYVGFRPNGWQSVIYDAVSIFRALRHEDMVVAFGVSGAVALPFAKLFSRKKIVVHTDGIEHRREKWNRVARWYLKLSEALAVRFADAVVVDNQAVADYIRGEYGIESPLVEFGGDNSVFDDVADEEGILSAYGVRAGEYAVAICRIEPENNPEMILEAFRRCGRRLLFIGNWRSTQLGVSLSERYGNVPNIVMAPAVYDKETVYVLRKCASVYVHGHSAGGTNPSLVEAMYLGLPVVAFDVVFNRQTTEGHAMYFKSVDELVNILGGEAYGDMGAVMREVAERRYKWDLIVDKFVDTLMSV